MYVGLVQLLHPRCSLLDKSLRASMQTITTLWRSHKLLFLGCGPLCGSWEGPAYPPWEQRPPMSVSTRYLRCTGWCSLTTLPSASAGDCLLSAAAGAHSAHMAGQGGLELILSHNGWWECMDKDTRLLALWMEWFSGIYSARALSGIRLQFPTMVICMVSFPIWLVSWDHHLNKLLVLLLN